ncbi:hypothetical protein BDW66DRAFT_125307 [Aspergillus desertorum]
MDPPFSVNNLFSPVAGHMPTVPFLHSSFLAYRSSRPLLTSSQALLYSASLSSFEYSPRCQSLVGYLNNGCSLPTGHMPTSRVRATTCKDKALNTWQGQTQTRILREGLSACLFSQFLNLVWAESLPSRGKGLRACTKLVGMELGSMQVKLKHITRKDCP